MYQSVTHYLNPFLLALKKYNFDDEKVLILISSIMVWNKTPPKMREVGKQEEQLDEENNEESKIEEEVKEKIDEGDESEFN